MLEWLKRTWKEIWREPDNRPKEYWYVEARWSGCTVSTEFNSLKEAFDYLYKRTETDWEFNIRKSRGKYLWDEWLKLQDVPGWKVPEKTNS